MKTKTLKIAAVWALIAAGLPAQNFSFQQAGSLAAPGSVPQLGEVWQSQWISGKPYSATVVTHTVQTFANGTKVDHTETALVYRDMQGRTRHESNADGNFHPGTVVSIDDPLAMLEYTYTVPKPGSGSMGRGGGPARHVYTVSMLSPNIVTNETRPEGPSPYEMAMGVGTRGSKRGGSTRPPAQIEDLKTQTINGLPAQGVRITTTIPAASIGNDRDIPVITERWVSRDLQVLVKSVYSDPRFGTTTYELTNISRTPPDPSLFQVPADYEKSGKRGGGNGGFPGTPVILPQSIKK